MRHVSLKWVMSHMSASVIKWMSHVSYEWVMTHMNESCHVLHESTSYVTWLVHMWHDSFICDMTHSYVTWLIHTWYVPWLICVTSYTNPHMSHGTYLSQVRAMTLDTWHSDTWHDSYIDSCGTWHDSLTSRVSKWVSFSSQRTFARWVMSHVQMTPPWVMSHICVCAMTHLDTWHSITWHDSYVDSCGTWHHSFIGHRVTNNWVMLLMNESCHTDEWVMSHTWTQEKQRSCSRRDVSHMIESRLTWMCHVTSRTSHVPLHMND